MFNVMMKNNDLSLDPRLSLAASFVRNGVHVCDVGTDHGYIPISLLLSGVTPSAYATDINEAPLKNAEKNAVKYGVFDKINFFLTDGLSGVPLDKYAMCDIVICGMGGELIASILAASDYVKSTGAHLVLQPMTKPDVLRKYLSTGYEIMDEGITKSMGKLYQCISCRYTGKNTDYTPSELEIGRVNIEKGCSNPLFLRLVVQNLSRLHKEIAGRRLGGLDISEQSALLSELQEILERTEKNDSI